MDFLYLFLALACACTVFRSSSCWRLSSEGHQCNQFHLVREDHVDLHLGSVSISSKVEENIEHDILCTDDASLHSIPTITPVVSCSDIDHLESAFNNIDRGGFYVPYCKPYYTFTQGGITYKKLACNCDIYPFVVVDPGHELKGSEILYLQKSIMPYTPGSHLLSKQKFLHPYMCGGINRPNFDKTHNGTWFGGTFGIGQFCPGPGYLNRQCRYMTKYRSEEAQVIFDNGVVTPGVNVTVINYNQTVRGDVNLETAFNLFYNNRFLMFHVALHTGYKVILGKVFECTSVSYVYEQRVACLSNHLLVLCFPTCRVANHILLADRIVHIGTCSGRAKINLADGLRIEAYKSPLPPPQFKRTSSGAIISALLFSGLILSLSFHIRFLVIFLFGTQCYAIREHYFHTVKDEACVAQHHTEPIMIVLYENLCHIVSNDHFNVINLTTPLESGCHLFCEKHTSLELGKNLHIHNMSVYNGTHYNSMYKIRACDANELDHTNTSLYSFHANKAMYHTSNDTYCYVNVTQYSPICYINNFNISIPFNGTKVTTVSRSLRYETLLTDPPDVYSVSHQEHLSQHLFKRFIDQSWTDLDAFVSSHSAFILASIYTSPLWQQTHGYKFLRYYLVNETLILGFCKSLPRLQVVVDTLCHEGYLLVCHDVCTRSHVNGSLANIVQGAFYNTTVYCNSTSTETLNIIIRPLNGVVVEEYIPSRIWTDAFNIWMLSLTSSLLSAWLLITLIMAIIISLPGLFKVIRALRSLFTFKRARFDKWK